MSGKGDNNFMLQKIIKGFYYILSACARRSFSLWDDETTLKLVTQDDTELKLDVRT